MIDRGAKIRVIDVAGWYDAGKIDTLLDTNRVVLAKGRARAPQAHAGVTIVDPVYIEDGVELDRCTVGPNVSISSGTVVRGSTLRDSIVGMRSRIIGCNIRESLIGDDVALEGVNGSVTIGDHSEVRVQGV
jgi:glucose-1-phosphate thymidylyltransferase